MPPTASSQRTKRTFASSVVLFVLVLTMPRLSAQVPLTFDVASIHQNQRGPDAPVSTNVPLGPGNVYTPTGGLFRAINYPLFSYIMFAWKMNDAQVAAFRSKAPEWVINDRFNIQARTENTAVTKDELRLMMRSLLADRFGLTVHTETQHLSGYVLQLAHPGVLGPRLRPHPSGVACQSTLPKPDEHGAPPAEVTPDGFPTTCGGLVLLPASAPGHIRIGGSDVPLSVLSTVLPGWGSLNRAVVDGTGLKGTYDYVLDFVPEHAASDPNVSGPLFQQALKEELGLKLEPQKVDVDIIVLDAIRKLDAN